MNIFLSILIYSFVAGLAAMGGVYLVYFFGARAKKSLVLFVSFAVGVLMANAFLHLLPEAAQTTALWPYGALGAIIFFYLIEQVIIIHACYEEGCETHSLGHMGLFGIGFHSLIDGLTIGIAFQAGFNVGLLASLAIVFHKISEGSCLYVLLLGGRFSQSKALFFSWLVALATPLGAMLAYFFTAQLAGQTLGLLLAGAAGAFIYISASDLVPLTHKEHNWKNGFMMLLGVGFILLISKFI
ncbi:MAG: ZIP family metal transporter [Candidatus Portnoybacteria bacterium]|nr:ZIP family metal transporter [Candidatus Portnoybacteria bacterium]MDD4982528.1 ZIP family metal transporter [Candidatus Portnoybacteria bacterium]